MLAPGPGGAADEWSTYYGTVIRVAGKFHMWHTGSGITPPNGLDLMEHHVQAIRKVLVDNLEELADLAGKLPEVQAGR